MTADRSSPKKSLFLKPKWSRPQVLESSNLFHRSHQIYAGLTAEAEYLKIVEPDRQTTPQRLHGGAIAKRRRLSSGDDGDHHLTSGNENPCKEASNQCVIAHPLERDDCLPQTSATWQPLPVATSKQITSNNDNVFHDKPRQVAGNVLNKPTKRHPSIINLDSDEHINDGEAHEHNYDDGKSIEMVKSFVTEDASSSSEEFPELVRKARAKARGNIEERSAGTSATHLLGNLTSAQYFEATPEFISDATVQILITSSIPKTQPLILKRKLGQRLKDVRLTWAERQGFAQSVADSIFLTWKGKRLFDVTTCMSLGTMSCSSGKAAVMDELMGNDDGRIHMEAMTAEILELRRNAKVENTMPADDVENEAKVPTSNESNSQVRLILKARDFAEFKLRVKPATVISKIVNAFRSTNQIQSEKEVYLSFDGERLALQSKIEDTEISDMDILDVHVQ